MTPLSTSAANSPDSSRPSSRKSSHSYFTTAGAGAGSSSSSGGASLSALTALKSLNRDQGGRATQGHGEIEEAVDEEDDTMGEAGLLRTGNQRLRRGSRRLSRMSSTLGEGASAHWTPARPRSPPPPSDPVPVTQPGSSRKASVAQQVEENGDPRKTNPVSAIELAAALRGQSPPKRDVALTPIEHAKKMAAYRAVDVHIKPHHKVIGIGSGSTVPYVVDRLLELGKQANAKRWFIPTGFQSKELIVNAGLNLGDVDQFPAIDVTIDGADDCDLALNCIKGGGACHLREKVLAEAANEFVIIADYRKNSNLLGESWKQGVPIEVPMFAYSKVLANLKRIPGCIDPTLRMGKAKAGPVVTDNSNFVIDAPFDEAHMREPAALLMKLKMLTGVVEVGLFVGMARAAYFGNEDGSVTVRWSDGQEETLKEGQQADITADMIDTTKTPAESLLLVNGYQNGHADATPEMLKSKLESLKMQVLDK